LFDRLSASGFDTTALREARLRKSPDALMEELPGVRALVEDREHVRNATGDDDRRHCTQCLNLASNGSCKAAERGEIVAARTYYPQLRQLQRCAGYQPNASDPDHRPAAERWPGMGDQ
jgi:hypothetical protein